MSTNQKLTLEQKWAMVARHSIYMDIKKGAVPRGTLKVLEKELNVRRGLLRINNCVMRGMDTL